MCRCVVVIVGMNGGKKKKKKNTGTGQTVDNGLERDHHSSLIYMEQQSNLRSSRYKRKRKRKSSNLHR